MIHQSCKIGSMFANPVTIIFSVQNKGWKLVSHSVKVKTLLQALTIIAFPIGNVQQVFVLPNWTLFGHMLKWVGSSLYIIYTCL